MPSLSRQSTPGRRGVLRASAWTIPAITATAATPAFAASGTQTFIFTKYQDHMWSTFEFSYVCLLQAPGRTTTLDDVTLTFTFSGDLAGTSTHTGVTGLRSFGGATAALATTSRITGPEGNQTVVTVPFPYVGDPRRDHALSGEFTMDRPAKVPLLGTITLFASAHDGSSVPETYTVDK